MRLNKDEENPCISAMAADSNRWLCHWKSFITIINAVLLNLWLTVNNGLQWLQVWFRVMSDGHQSGYVRGVIFRTAEGQWTVGWYLGGSPFIHIIISMVLLGTFLFSGFALSIYLIYKYHKYIPFKKTCTIPRHPRNFRETISILVAAMLLITFFVGIIGTKIDPNIIVHVKPSNDALIETTVVSAFLEITVVRSASLEVHPSFINKNDLNGSFYCVVKTQKNASWHTNEIETLTISLNGRTIFSMASHFCNSQNGLELEFDKSLFRSSLESENAIEERISILEVNGRLRNGDFFAGNVPITILAYHHAGMARSGATN